MSRLVLGHTQSPIQWVLGVRQPEHKTDHSHLVPKVKNE
jgi:hypothetical protein